MKMKKKLIFIFSIFILFSCNEDLTDMNKNPKKPEVVSHETLFSNAQLELVNNLTSTDVNLNIFRLIAQQWTQTTYTDESNYDLSTRNIPQNFWHALYRDILKDFDESKKLLTAENTLDPKVKANRLAIIEIMEVQTYSVLVNVFGNIPYEEALNIDDINPGYDDAVKIYDDLIVKLDAAISSLDPSAEAFGDADLLYASGGASAWILFANSLKLKLGMVLADSDPVKAKTIVSQAAPNVLKSNADNAVFIYSTVPPNTNPIWDDLVQSGRKDYVGANTLVDKLNDLDDPRRSYFFTTVDNEFVGGTYAASNNYASFSHVSEKVIAPNFEALLMDYSEVEFLLAEAVERGFITGIAEDHYKNGITASITYWGGTENMANAYLAMPEVNYKTASGDFKEKIGTQLWIALYNRGYEAWTNWRRLDYPIFNVPEDLTYEDIPVRFTYPVSEQNLNKVNYSSASQAIGEDLPTTKLFWDKH
jgi:hypothetical protein